MLYDASPAIKILLQFALESVCPYYECGTVEIEDRLAKTVLDLEEKCCRGGGWVREIRI